jgi:uncharacterized protein (DUF1015 family)
LSIALPFKAWLPSEEFASQVAVRSSGYANNTEILALLAENPLCYLHAVKPYLHFGTDKKNPELHFAHGANYIKQLIASGVLKQAKETGYFLYRQTSIETGSYYQGVIGLCSADAYLSNKVKRHENTLTNKENLLIEHIDYTKMGGEPVLIMHDSQHDLETLKREICAEYPLISFDSEGSRHELWSVLGDKVDSLQAELDKISTMYIADGHHRSSASTRYIQAGKTSTKGFMTLFMDKADLHIEPFHRLVKTDVNDLMEFLNSNNFKVEIINNFHALEKRKKCFGFYFDNNWYQIEYTGVYFKEGTLDVSIIEEAFINDYCGIKDSKADDRVDFVEGNLPIYQAEHRVNANEFNLLIALNPCEIQDICTVADMGETMPPKSTYVLPKLLTGLTINQF